SPEPIERCREQLWTAGCGRCRFRPLCWTGRRPGRSSARSSRSPIPRTRSPERAPGRPETTTARIPARDTGRRQARSDRADALRLRTLRALGDLELDALRLIEGAVTLGLDGGVVDEDVVTTAVLGD